MTRIIDLIKISFKIIFAFVAFCGTKGCGDVLLPNGAIPMLILKKKKENVNNNDIIILLIYLSYFAVWKNHIYMSVFFIEKVREI